MMKPASFLPAAIICGALLANAAQAQFLWSQRLASTINTDFEFPTGMTLDSQRNIYVCGWFDGTNDFGGVTLTNDSGGGQDIFVAKYSPTGALQWAQRAGGSSSNMDAAVGIGVDTNGNVYVTGQVYGPADFGSFNLPASQDSVFFLAKYNNAGAVQWVQGGVAGAYAQALGTGLAVDGSGNSYAVGYVDNYGETITFGSTNLLNPNTTGYSTFLVKYDTTGTVRWAQLLGGPDATYATSVAVDGADNVYVRGEFSSTMTIGGSTLVSAGSTKNMFIAKFDNSGTLIWVRQPTGGNGGTGGVAVDQAENVYVTGAYDTLLDFGGNIRLMNGGSTDAFVAKYSSSGAIQWAQAAGGATPGAFGWYEDVCLDGQGNVYSAGTFGTGGSPAATIAKYDPAGTLQWTYSASGPPANPLSSIVEGCAVDSAGITYLAGRYQGTVTFGANILQPQGYWNFFLAALSLTDTETPTQTPTLTPFPISTPTPTPTFTQTWTSTPLSTSTPTSLPTSVVTGTPLPCTGDCNGSGDVTVSEIITLVNMALGTQTQLSACPDGLPPSITNVSEVDIALIIQAVNNALNGCPAPVATPTPTPTVTSPFIGVFTGTFAFIAGKDQGLTGQATIVIGANGVAGAAFGGGFLDMSGSANLVTGAVQLSGDDFTASVQLEASGAGSGAFTGNDGDSGTITITPPRANLTSNYVGVYRGTINITARPAGPDGTDGSNNWPIELFVANDGSAAGDTFDPSGDGFLFQGTVNFTSGVFTLAVINNGGRDGLTGITGNLTGATLASGTFNLSNGDTGTVSFAKVAP